VGQPCQNREGRRTVTNAELMGTNSRLFEKKKQAEGPGSRPCSSWGLKTSLAVLNQRGLIRQEERGERGGARLSDLRPTRQPEARRIALGENVQSLEGCFLLKEHDMRGKGHREGLGEACFLRTHRNALNSIQGTRKG